MAHAPTILIDTNIISAMHYMGGEVRAVARRRLTRDWWEVERQYYQVRASWITEMELRQGAYKWQIQSISTVRRMRYLPHFKGIDNCAERLVALKVIPHNKDGDAIHLAMAIIHKIDYLLTWNYAHLDNRDVKSKLIEVCEIEGWRMPSIVSPESIPWASMGHEIKRRD